MEIIVLLIAVSSLVALIFLVGFLWSARDGQFDDLKTPAMRILDEDS